MNKLDDALTSLIDDATPIDNKEYAPIHKDAIILATLIFSLRDNFKPCDNDIKDNLSRLATMVPTDIICGIMAITYYEQFELFHNASRNLLKLKTWLTVCVESQIINMDTFKEINTVANKLNTALSDAVAELDKIIANGGNEDDE